MRSVKQIVEWLEAFAPRELAAEWDNVGLLLGETARNVERAMTCLTITPPVVEEAVAANVNLIIAHHPVLFRGAKSLSSTTSEGRLLLPLLRAGIAVYSPHTSFDNCSGGINDQLAKTLNLQNVQPLRPRRVSRECKLVVFVPISDLTNVSDALFAAGAGIIGQYEQCSFRTTGAGTFFGTDGTNPRVGEKGRRMMVEEWRLEVRVPMPRLDAAITALRKAHSYEEPAFEVYPLQALANGGEGRLGELATAMDLGTIARNLNVALNANGVQIVGEESKAIRRVAIACGAAGEFLPDAIRAGADAFLTGEVRFHDALAAESAGIALILPGHYATERPAVEALAQRLTDAFPTLQVWPSRHERDPLH